VTVDQNGLFVNQKTAAKGKRFVELRDRARSFVVLQSHFGQVGNEGVGDEYPAALAEDDDLAHRIHEGCTEDPVPFLDDELWLPLGNLAHDGSHGSVPALQGISLEGGLVRRFEGDEGIPSPFDASSEAPLVLVGRERDLAACGSVAIRSVGSKYEHGSTLRTAGVRCLAVGAPDDGLLACAVDRRTFFCDNSLVCIFKLLRWWRTCSEQAETQEHDPCQMSHSVLREGLNLADFVASVND